MIVDNMKFWELEDNREYKCKATKQRYRTTSKGRVYKYSSGIVPWELYDPRYSELKDMEFEPQRSVEECNHKTYYGDFTLEYSSKQLSKDMDLNIMHCVSCGKSGHKSQLTGIKMGNTEIENIHPDKEEIRIWKDI